MRIFFLAAAAATLSVLSGGPVGAKSISTSITVSVTFVDDCAASSIANARSGAVVTESCSDGASATGLQSIGRAAGRSAMVRPMVTVDSQRSLRTFDF